MLKFLFIVEFSTANCYPHQTTIPKELILRENVIVTQTLTNLSHRATVFAHNIDRSSSVDAFIVVLVVIIFVVGPAYTTTVHRFQKVRPFDLAH